MLKYEDYQQAKAMAALVNGWLAEPDGTPLENADSELTETIRTIRDLLVQVAQMPGACIPEPSRSFSRSDLAAAAIMEAAESPLDPAAELARFRADSELMERL